MHQAYSIRLSRIISTLALFLLISPTSSFGQDDEKRPLDHSDYDLWNSLGQQSISNDGKYVLYSVRSGKGESVLNIREVETSTEYSITRGSGARFSFDSKFAIFMINPDPEIIKKLRKEKAKPEQMPKAKMQIVELATGQAFTVNDVRSFSTPEKNGQWLAYLLHAPKDDKKLKANKGTTQVLENTVVGLVKVKSLKRKPVKKGPESAEQKEKKKNTRPAESQKVNGKNKKPAPEKKKANGTVLVIRNLVTHEERRLPNVTSYRFDKDGNRLVLATSAAKPEQDGVHIVDLKSQQKKQVISGRGNYRSLTISESGKLVAFLTDRDDYQAKQSSWSVYMVNRSAHHASKIIDDKSTGIPTGWWLATASPAFSEDERRLYFNTRPKPDDLGKENPKDSKDEEPKAKLDIWHWKDPLLQPQQLLMAAAERNRSYRAVFDLRSREIVQLANKTVESVIADPRSSSNVALGIDRRRYAMETSWESPRSQDVYLVNQTTGQRKRALEKLQGSAMLSSAGKFLIWWDAPSRKWFSLDTATFLKSKSQDIAPVEISKQIPYPLFNELHDTPSHPGNYGIAGWSENDESVFIYDAFDLWQVDPKGKNQPQCVTRGYGRKNMVRLRYTRLDREQRTIPANETMLFSTFDRRSKSSGYCSIDPNTKAEPTILIQMDEQIGGLVKSKNSKHVIFTRQTFQKSPDIWRSTTDFQTLHRISKINPQQKNYNWGSAELVHWKSKTGQDLDGILYKPDDFDPKKKYPMMVYFYERNSDNLHRYYAPAAGRSIINFSFYVSRGYLIFVPDIPYRKGIPGQSCYDSVIPGVEHMIQQGYVDEKKIGVQGHSWGGYQIAYLVTKTNIFACAEAGAPVSNMTSAYGGIRWGSGMSRMFQYERTQSRIGETLWQARDKYLENSPVFFADKIETPLLILHNDQDGAVPWYQGIELFVAMRRLGKPAWMLNYNGEPHWVMKEENRRDFATRMQQFFDHYLKDAPAPKWLKEGIPAVDKGKKFGLETK